MCWTSQWLGQYFTLNWNVFNSKYFIEFDGHHNCVLKHSQNRIRTINQLLQLNIGLSRNQSWAFLINCDLVPALKVVFPKIVFTALHVQTLSTNMLLVVNLCRSLITEAYYSIGSLHTSSNQINFCILQRPFRVIFVTRSLLRLWEW